MKRLLSLLLVLCLFLPALAAQAVLRDGQEVLLSPQGLRVTGREADCEKYNIGGSNYFKLRDLAWLLNGTASQFSVEWDGARRLISLTTGRPYDEPDGTELVLSGDHAETAQLSAQTLMIDGVLRDDLQAWNINGSNYFQLRELGAALGFLVDYEASTNTALVCSMDYVPPAADPLTLEQRSISTSEGEVTAWVLIADTRSPRVSARSYMASGTLGAVADFGDMVRDTGAYAAVNGNFFEAYQPFQTPIGHVMADGEFLYGVSGLSNLGIDREGRLHMGREPVFTRFTSEGKTWVVYEINSVQGQFESNAVLFTPAFGASLTLTLGAFLMTVREGRIADYRWAEAGTEAEIPGDGYLLYLTRSFTEEPWVPEPVVGAPIFGPEYALSRPTEDSFPLDGIVSILSGSPRLVQGGALCYDLDAGYDDLQRFGPGVAAPRTAAGIGGDGRLVLVSTAAATIQQMRELMLALGCTEALNLDGGASRGMYCGGSFQAVPGRLLTTALLLFLEE